MAGPQLNSTKNFSRGLTLVELLMGAVILAIVIVVLLEVMARHTILNEHSRNLSWAMNDATRLMEKMRQQNSGTACATPSVAPPTGFTSWDKWLGATAGGGRKSIQPDPDTNELVVVTPKGTDPIQVTVAVCWRHRTRVVGECQWSGTQLERSDIDGNDVITSPAMLSTSLSCRR